MDALIPQGAQAQDLAALGEVPCDWSKLDKRAWALSGFRDSTLLGCFLLLPVWRGRWQASLVLSMDVTRADLLWVHRTVLGQMDWIKHDRAYARIECSVLCGFPSGIRWAKMLGFDLEGRMRHYDVLGRDHYLFARIIHDGC